MGTFYLWKAIFGGTDGTVGGYAFRGMISYFLAMLLFDALTSPTEDDFQIAGEIRDGLINQFLLKPLDYLVYRLSLFWSYRLIDTGITLGSVVVMLVWMRQYLDLPSSPWVWGMAFVLAVLSATLQFLMTYCSAMMMFWVLDIAAPVFIVYSIEFLGCGHLFPLDLLPKWIYNMLMWLPFP